MPVERFSYEHRVTQSELIEVVIDVALKLGLGVGLRLGLGLGSGSDLRGGACRNSVASVWQPFRSGSGLLPGWLSGLWLLGLSNVAVSVRQAFRTAAQSTSS